MNLQKRGFDNPLLKVIFNTIDHITLINVNGMFRNKFIIFVIVVFIFKPLASIGQSKDTVDIIISSNNHDTVLCKKLLSLSKLMHTSGNYQLAIKASKYSLDIYTKFHHIPGQYSSLERLTLSSVKSNDTVNAKLYLKAMYDIALATKNIKYKNGAAVLESRMNYQLNNFEKAISLSQAVIESSKELFDSMLVPKAYILIANTYMKQGNYKKAGENYFEAVKIAEAIKDSSTMAVCYTNLGTINRFLGNCNDAIYYHKNALGICKELNDINGIANAYATLGDSYGCLKNSDSAIYCFKMAVPFLLKLKNFSGLSTIYGNLGNRFIEDKQLDSGLFYLGRANETFLLTGDSISIANNTWALGDAFLSMYNQTKKNIYLNQAFQAFTVSEGIAKRYQLESLKVFVFKSLSKVYEIKGIIKEALFYLKEYNLINDSILSSNLTSQIAEMQTKYETEKKEIEIEKLNSDKLLDAEKIARQKTFNVSLIVIATLILISGFLIFRNVQKKRHAEKQVAILEKQNAIESMRSKIAIDVHDDMGANLTKLGLNAQQLLISATTSEKEKQLAEKISLQSKEVITGMKEIIWASNPANDNLKSLLGFMRQYIDRFFDGTDIRPVVNFPHHIGEITLHPEVRRNLFLILKESLNNAIKYSGSNKIDIDFSNENENFNLNIKDYGKGMDDKAKNDFSNGLNNMQMRAEQIQSLFKLISSPGNGVQIAVEGKLY